MTNSSKVKGSQYERDVVAYLKAHGFPKAQRRYGAGATNDTGDVHGVPDFVLELKAEKAIDLAGYMDETETEKLNANETYGAAIIKRRNRNVSQSYVVMDLASFCEFIKERA